jgi:hypothetical protein
MSSPRWRRVGWIAPTLSAFFVIAHQAAYGKADAAQWTFSLGFVVYAAVGGLIVDRYPRNPVGWLFCVVGVAFSAGDFMSSYADEGTGPGAKALAIFNTASGPTTLLVLALAVMLFPNGHFQSPRWRRAAKVLIAANVVGSLVLLFEPGPLRGNPRIDNALGIDAAAGLLHALAGVSSVVFAATVLTALASIVVRFHTARGLERQQLKWIALLGLVAVAVLAGLLVLGQFVNLDSGPGRVVAGVVLGLVSTTPALAAAIAILRYRLYDVDVVINRALVYGALTATLGAAYLGLVLLIGLAIGKSGFAVAVSTLAVAALFGPARARIQSGVDRRFYRRRYDAARTLAGFGARLRDQVELDALCAELRGVVRETVQPAHVSLWLRAPQ